MSGTIAVYNARKSLLPEMQPNELMQTSCFKEIALNIAANVPSIREGAAIINRIQWRLGEHDAVKYRQLRDHVIREGAIFMSTVESIAHNTLQAHNFDITTGCPTNISSINSAIAKPDCTAIPSSEINNIINDYNESLEHDMQIDLAQVHEEYIPDEQCVNISLDDVGVVGQKETGRMKNSPPKEHRRYVKNTIIHVQQMAGQYILNALGIKKAIVLLSAFLLNCNLLEDKMLVFFVDGAVDLKDAIYMAFQWRPFRIILDWYHLKKKCGERLSMAMKGRDPRNKALQLILQQLWLGKVDAAIDILQCIDAKTIKAPEHIDKLIAYFKRNYSYIPCYALRKKLNLRNSSNRGEKANDLVVAGRQKHQGMSWSKSGSSGMAAICTTIQNDELSNWVRNRELSFSLRYPKDSEHNAA